MSSALLQLHGSELQSPASSFSLLLQPWQRGARAYWFRFRISRFGFAVKYSGFLHTS
ncbi:hypothetical protein BDA96_02G172900 [Sorghum bicolor]|uniref:Uncharacterized protein n=1 Tax=Sorghum bicolor TaxID=4558 RepID=A0A921UT56_SORBI|nr:hypothetical protein BDA96_02G172900 [Sorghum bicolor]